MGIEIQVNSLDEMCDLMCYNKIPRKKVRKMKPKDEIQEAFLTVGIVVRARIEELCNKHKWQDAEEIQEAYNCINKYFDDALAWPE